MSKEKAAATWTQADANGVYWWRYDKSYEPEIVEVRDGEFYSIAEPDPTSVSAGEFLGPITPELFSEVAQLREALQPLYERLQKMMDDGPDCECPAEGHMCGWPGLQKEMKVAALALKENERGDK
jgi:hypothetical protein